MRVRAGDEHVFLILHSRHVTPVAQPLLPRDAAPPPSLHLEAVGHEAEAAERRGGGTVGGGTVGVASQTREGTVGGCSARSITGQ